jgi:glyoxylase-like metal-dependent hydrolase (beta-lactamase superfamily II)
MRAALLGFMAWSLLALGACSAPVRWVRPVSLSVSAQDTVTVHTLPLGVDHAYLLVNGGSAILVDGGAPGELLRFTEGMERAGLSARAIRLVVITHGHWDHVGTAADIRRLTMAPLAMHAREREWLERGEKVMPPSVGVRGWLMAQMLNRGVVPWVLVPPSPVDVVLTDQGLSLRPFGIPGRVVSTPGHSRGSVTVLLESGDAFVGDMAMNALPMTNGPDLPIFAEDMDQLKRSWRELLAAGAKTIYPAHGDPFPAAHMRALVGP